MAQVGLDLLLPPQPLDRRGRAGGAGLPAEAWTRIAFIEQPTCPGCSLPFEHDMGGLACPACQARPRAFARLRAACVYDEHSRDLILKLKHADRPDLAPLFARWIARVAPELLTEADALVPVPLHRARLLKRRYNQAAEIARPLGRLAARPVWPDVLVRRKATASQGGKSGAGRRRNVQGAFAVPEPAQARVAGRRLLLIDDVFTTGATAEACARTLLRAGAAAVDVAVVARVREGPDLTI